MASNSFGQIFRMTTFGESHGPYIGVVIDGCPSRLELSVEEIQKALDRRKPGTNSYTSPRKEQDKAQIISGVFEGKTTGAPITILIPNEMADSSPYEALKNIYRPGHANFTYLEKYGIFDYRGGGRSSARETAARVAAGAVADLILQQHQVYCTAYLQEAGSIAIESFDPEIFQKSAIFCPCKCAEQKIIERIERLKQEGDSIGGIVQASLLVPKGLGDPIYEKLEAKLSFAMLSIPASKGFEIGEGFQAAKMLGSQHNDTFSLTGQDIHTKTNHAGGILGGISTGSPISFRVAFKPTSSIRKEQQSMTYDKKKAAIAFSANAKHDPCIAIRAVPVVEAMSKIVLADAILMHHATQPLRQIDMERFSRLD